MLKQILKMNNEQTGSYVETTRVRGFSKCSSLSIYGTCGQFLTDVAFMVINNHTRRAPNLTPNRRTSISFV